MNKDQLVALRNLALDLHQQAGALVTIPTDGAIAGSSDPTTTRIAMQKLLDASLHDIESMQELLNT